MRPGLAHADIHVRSLATAQAYEVIELVSHIFLQHAVVKMRLFARVLCLEGHDDLAAEATAAFERQEPKEEDEEDDVAEDAGRMKGKCALEEL
jgi:hypothetical protein